MAANKRSSAQIVTDRERIWEMKLRGWNHTEIARELSMTREMVIYDVHALERQIRERTEHNFTLEREVELGRLNLIIRLADSGYTRSLQERRKSRTRQRSDVKPPTVRALGRTAQGGAGAVAEAVRSTLNEATTETEQRIGDARFLAVMLRATELRIGLLGLQTDRGPDVSDEPIREIVIRRDAALEPSNADLADDETELPATDGEYRDPLDDEDEDRVIVTPPRMLRSPEAADLDPRY
jgi:hypothetical protein